MPLRPVVRLSRSPELAGRYSCDYYGHSVAIGLASRRRSHVHKCYTSERDLGVPFASFNALTGHRSCVPEDYGMLLQFRRRDRRRLQASFRRGTSYPFWRLGFRQSSFRHITRIFPARRPVRLGTAAGFLACYCPLHLSDLGSAIRSRDISSHLCPLRGRYSTAPRGAAAGKYSNPASRHRPHTVVANLAAAPTTEIDVPATRSHRGGHGPSAMRTRPSSRSIMTGIERRSDPRLTEQTWDR